MKDTAKSTDMIEILTPDFSFSDERGFLCQLVHEGYTQVNVAYSKAGALRGGHFHRLNKEAFYVVEGRFRVCLTDGRRKEQYEFKKGDMFAIPKNIVHDFVYTEDTVLVGLYDAGIELPGGSRDIIPAQALSDLI